MVVPEGNITFFGVLNKECLLLVHSYWLIWVTVKQTNVLCGQAYRKFPEKTPDTSWGEWEVSGEGSGGLI